MTSTRFSGYYEDKHCPTTLTTVRNTPPTIQLDSTPTTYPQDLLQDIHAAAQRHPTYYITGFSTIHSKRRHYYSYDL